VILRSGEFQGNAQKLQSLKSLIRGALANGPSDVDMRRLEHLSTLGLPLSGRTVADVGAWNEHSTRYFLDRKCKVTLSGASAEATETARAQLALASDNVAFAQYDLDGAPLESLEPRYDVTHCSDWLWRSADISCALDNLKRMTRHVLIVDTLFTPGARPALFKDVGGDEATGRPRLYEVPTRAWVAERLAQDFPYVYYPRSQPNHRDFPTNWTAGSFKKARAIMIAAREPLQNPRLTNEAPARYEYAC
jgi:hypothetical protein